MDMGSTNASREYLKNAVMTAPPEQLQLMLFDGAIRFTLRGQDALHNKDFEGAFNGFDRAQRVVLQLIAGLKPEVNPELVEQMSALYHFIYDRLVEANHKRDTRSADDALRILRHQRETWVMLLDRLAAERAEATQPAPREAAVEAAAIYLDG